jgi:hypothetical protein
MATEYLETILFQLLNVNLRDADKRRLETWYGLMEHVDEESREEMKEALYRFVIESINAQRVIRMLQRNLPEKDEEDREDGGDDDENDVGW